MLNNRRAGQPRRIERIGNLKHARLSEGFAAFELIPDFAILVIDRNFQRQAALCYLNLHGGFAVPHVADGDFAEIAQREFVQIGSNGIGARQQVDIILRSPGKGRFG